MAQDGEGQVVLLSGEPGIGKSRILSALWERLEGQGVEVDEGMKTASSGWARDEGKPVRVFFSFDGNGKIRQTHCEPSPPEISTKQDR